MKKIFIFGLGLGLLIGAGCNSSTDSVKEAQKANDANTDSMAKQQSITDSAAAASKEDADFLVKAASGGVLEVELGNLAQSNGAKKGVKDFGAMMVEDHSKGGATLKMLAMSKKVILADSMSNDQKKERDDLMKKHGAEFDRSYVTLMVKDHKEDIDEFEKAAKNAHDPEIRQFAQNTLPMLHHHLDSVQALEKMMPRKLSGPKAAPLN